MMLIIVYIHASSPIEIATFVQDVTPALLATIESEFEKVSKSDPPLPTKTSAPVSCLAHRLLHP